MEYDSGSSCEGRKDLEESGTLVERKETKEGAEREILARSSALLSWYNPEQAPRTTVLPVVSKKSLSSQVMEYYHKYSQNSSLGRYFSLNERGSGSPETNYIQSGYGSSLDPSRFPVESYIVLADDERFRQDSSIPRERRRWARPPLLGQTSASEGAITSNYVGTDSRTPSPISKRPATETIPEERNESSRETLVEPIDGETKPSVSPTSSVTSHKPLEWDSGADVGYYYNETAPRAKEKDKKLCTIERIALARGCSVAMRLDPEGTNESTTSSGAGTKNSMKPDANSTPLVGHISAESENEVEITPIVKNHTPLMTKLREDESLRDFDRITESRGAKGQGDESLTNLGASSVQIKYPTEGSRSNETENSKSSPLKKSSSMNLLALPMSRLSLKRSQSELNLRAKEKKALPLIFDSTSSIATVVNKPTTCDKFIQTSLNGYSRESIGIQVEVTSEESDFIEKEDKEKSGEKKEGDEDEEKPPLPKRASSLVPKSLHSILKTSSDTYSIRDRSSAPTKVSGNRNADAKGNKTEERNYSQKNEDRVDGAGPSRTKEKTREMGRTSEHGDISSEPSQNESSEILVEETTEENANGRASNSFEYFPGHVCQNVPNGSTSQVSSCETGRDSRCSTMPNTSSSIDEKLWGDSDSLVRDLERSVNILKSLVDANKCDKQVKKRLIHHVIKRLVTAKYTDDRIEHDLEDNVPWNPADTRNKVYRNDIIQALANNKQHNTTDSSVEDWKPRKRTPGRGNSSSPKRSIPKDNRVLREIIELAASSRGSTINSDKFPFDRHTDRTVMDGRKARMGLRSEDQRRNIATDVEKSESSECFMPQLKNQHKIKSTNIYYSIDKNNEKLRESTENNEREETASVTPSATTTSTTMTTTTTTSSTSVTSTNASHRNPISNRIILIKERPRTESNETDWRLPTTMSEKRFELGKCGNSECGDAKLINYAEMEKRNQLVWITNEISHLCNLKRLLEEPKKIENRLRGGHSPRKRLGGLPIDNWIVRARERNSSSRTRGTGSEAVGDISPREESLEKVLENQWSSHGNLASGRSEQRISAKRDEERVGHTRKRNSCTQTGNDGGPSGHSKTGGEIISATLPIFTSTISARTEHLTTLVTRDASVQTRTISPERMSSMQGCSDPQRRIGHSSNCPTRVGQLESSSDEKKSTGSQRHVCYCQRYAVHSRHKFCIIHSPQRSARQHLKNCPQKSKLKNEERPIITQAKITQISSSKSTDSGKETKNQLNATCKSNYAIRELPARSKSNCPRCNLEKVSSIPEVRIEELKTVEKNLTSDDSTEICICSRECNCEDDRAGSIENKNHPERKDAIEKESCCETGNEETFRKCPCLMEKHRSIYREAGGGGGGSKNENSKENVRTMEKNGVEKICRSCRTCGKVWAVKDGKNVNRRCKCSQDYLKPVAYELKFDETIKEKPKIVDGKKNKKVEKIITKGLSTGNKIQSRRTVSVTGSSEGNCSCDKNEVEDDDEDKDKDSKEDKRPGTLKDFLATNRPEFLENVETRRRYMNELAQLRQLRREKRKQFLAIAGASGLIKPSRPSKVSTANAQRKISDYEMKLRLRMRYLRLNEVRNKRRQREKEEDARRNHLMAKLFGQKLQQKVLKGQVDLSQSVSVISNL